MATHISRQVARTRPLTAYLFHKSFLRGLSSAPTSAVTRYSARIFCVNRFSCRVRFPFCRYFFLFVSVSCGGLSLLSVSFAAHAKHLPSQSYSRIPPASRKPIRGLRGLHRPEFRKLRLGKLRVWGSGCKPHHGLVRFGDPRKLSVFILFSYTTVTTELCKIESSRSTVTTRSLGRQLSLQN